MNINKSKLIKITLKNVKNITKEVRKAGKFYETLMRNKSKFRFKFIQKNANFIKNLDF